MTLSVYRTKIENYELFKVTRNHKELYFAKLQEHICDANGNIIIRTNTVSITADVYEAFFEHHRHERNQKRWTERHVVVLSEEDREYEEEVLYSRSIGPEPKAVEEEAMNNVFMEEVEKVIGGLEESHQRRLHDRFYGGLTYEEIGNRESCSKQAVRKGIQTAIRIIRKLLGLD